MLGFDIDRLRVSRGVAERLHHQIGVKAQTGKLLEFIASHRTRGVLTADRAHARLAVGARTNAVGATGLADNFLGQREAGVAGNRCFGYAEHVADRQAERFARFGGQGAADDQRNATTRMDFVIEHIGFELELGQQLAGFIFDAAFKRLEDDDIAHVQIINRALDRQRARVFKRVEEDRCNLAADDKAALLLVRHMGDFITDGPQHRVGRALA